MGNMTLPDSVSHPPGERRASAGLRTAI
jgi:hypothetical protein